MKEFRRKQRAWIETNHGFAFWRELHNQGSYFFFSYIGQSVLQMKKTEDKIDILEE